MSSKNAPPLPKWHDLRMFPNAPPSGQILVSFEVTEYEIDFPVSSNIYDFSRFIRYQPVSFEIHVLGLRDLKSSGILPVKKASISFNFKNLIGSKGVDSGFQVENKTTVPSQSGPNPTINTLLKYEMLLPINKLICPDLFCTVNDNIF